MSKLISSNNQESLLDALWDSVGTAYTAWNLNVVDTNSNSNSYIFKLQTNGFDEFAVRKDGLTTFGGIALSGVGGTNNVFSHLDFASGYEPKLNGAAVNAANGLAKLGAGGVLAANLGGTGGDGDKGDITVGSSGASWTIDNDAVTYAKIQNVSAASRILGRGSASGAGDVQELTAGTGLLVSGTVLISTVAGISDGDKGDITVSATGATWTIDSGAVTYAKIQNVSATDRLLGRSTAGAGVIEEITCTAAGRAILDDADATAQRTTLGLGALATQGDGDKGDITVGSSGATWTIDNSAVTYAKIQNVSATDKLLGRSTAGAGIVEEITCTAAGRAILDDADATAQRTTLGLGALATQGDGDKGDITVSGTGGTWTIDANAVTYAKIQDVSATDRILGRSSAGAGDIQEITCTAAGRALLDDADATAQRTTLGLGALATQGDGDKGDITVGSSGATWTIDNDAVTYAKIQNVSATDKLLGRSTAGAGDIEEITCTAAGRAILDDADAAAQRTTLSLGSTNDVAFASISTSGGDFDSSGDARSRRLVMRRLTTDASTSEMFINGSSTRATLSNDSRWLATIRFIATTNTAGAEWAVFERRCMISRGTTAGSTALVGNVQFVGSDSGSSNGSPPSGWSVTVSADTTNGALKLEAKGVTAKNIRWVAEVNLVEVMFA